MTKLTDRFRRLLQKPGSIDLRPYQRLVASVAERADAVRELTEDELREAVLQLGTDEPGGLTDDQLVEFLALAREAAERKIGRASCRERVWIPV